MTRPVDGQVLVEGRAVLRRVEGRRAVWDERAAVLVEGNRIVAVGPSDKMREKHPQAAKAGSDRSLVIPGLVNAHHHMGVTPFQLGIPDLPLELWIPARLAMQRLDPRLDTLFSAMEMLHSGVTTVQHLDVRAHGRPEDLLRDAESVIAAYGEIGMRVSYSSGFRDQNRILYAEDEYVIQQVPQRFQSKLRSLLDGMSMPLSEQVGVFLALWQRHGAPSDGRAAVQLAPVNLHWLSDEALARCAELVGETGAHAHTHLLETPFQRAYAFKRGRKSAVEYLGDFGLLGPRLTVGHGVWLSNEDVELLASSGTRMCHNCSSNWRLSSGQADVLQALEAGLTVGLGIDEAGINDDRDMLQELRMAMVTSRRPGLEGRALSADDVLGMATSGGAATTPFGANVGALEPGRLADLVVLDHDAMTYPFQGGATSLSDLVVYRARPSHVRAVLVGGEWVVWDGALTRVDEEEVLKAVAGMLMDLALEDRRGELELAEEVGRVARGFYSDYLPSGWDAV